MTRKPRGRMKISIGLLISLAVHTAVIATVAIEIPEPPVTTVALEVVETTPAQRDEPEPVVPVIEIRPPGMSLPTGSAAGPASDATSSSAAGVRAASAASHVQRRLEASGSSTVLLAQRAPEVEFTPVVLASSPSGSESDQTSEAAMPRPGRGVVLREDGASGHTGTGVRGTNGRGFGGGAGGVTIIGPGGDCITPGLPQGGRTSGEAVPFGGRTGRIGAGRQMGRGTSVLGRGR